jgi:hypothetical protein
MTDQAKIEKARAVYRLFHQLATTFGAHNVERQALDSVVSAGFVHRYRIGDLATVDVHAESATRFGRKAPKGEPALRFEVNWPGIGAKSWEHALAFGSGLAHVAQLVNQCQNTVAGSGLTSEDFEEAKNTVDGIAIKVRERLTKAAGTVKIDVEHVIKGVLGDLGV